MLLLAGLSTGNKIGLALVAAIFIAFALSASFLAPRRWPNFPGRNALSVFIIACLALFAGMIAAVFFFGRETEEAHGASAAAGPAKTIDVTEREYRITLPATGELKAGTYTFAVHNAGHVAHNLAIEGGDVSGTQSTATIQPGGDATLKVRLGPGRYTLYCSIDDHRRLGMQAALAVG